MEKCNLNLFFLTLMVLLVSCQKESLTVLQKRTVPDSFPGVIEQENQNRTYIDANLNICWQVGDQVAAFMQNTAADCYQVEDAADGCTSGIFHLVKSPEDGSFGAGTAINEQIVYYPYSNCLELRNSRDDRFRYELKGADFPAVQRYDVEHILSQNMLPMVAFSTVSGRSLAFKNLGGVLEIQLKGTARIRSIRLESNVENDPVCGAATIFLSDNQTPVTEIDLDGKIVPSCSITLDCGSEGVALNPEIPTSFRMVLPPKVFSAGFEVLVKDTKGGTMTKKTLSEKEVKRCRILKMYPIDYIPDPIDFSVEIKGVRFTMKAVKGGSFIMGATAEQESEADEDEKPAHEVTLSDYYIGETEVTQALWKAVMGSNPSDNQSDLNCPVEKVSWSDAVNGFIPKLNEMTGMNFFLPTEAQWEYAARGGNKAKGKKYSGNDDLDQVAWYRNNSGLHTHPVASKLPNELGIYDMSGNVYEWCSDWYGSYDAAEQTDPQGPADGHSRVARGGSHSAQAGFCRVTLRYGSNPAPRSKFYGLRLACAQL